MTVEDIVLEVAKWNDKKTEVCEYLAPDFRINYSGIYDIVELYLNNENVSITDDRAIRDICAFLLQAALSSLEEKDVRFYATVAVIYDCLSMHGI